MVKKTPVASPGPGLQLQPIVHVRAMAASIAFYERLGAEIIHGGRGSDWVLMQLGTIQIGLLACPPDAEHGANGVELHFAAAAPLQDLHRILPGARMTGPAGVGRQLHVTSPDGLLIKISQREPDE